MGSVGDLILVQYYQVLIVASQSSDRVKHAGSGTELSHARKTAASERQVAMGPPAGASTSKFRCFEEATFETY